MINLSFVRSKHFDDTHQLILSLQASCCQLSPGAEGGRGGGEGGEEENHSDHGDIGQKKDDVGVDDGDHGVVDHHPWGWR